MNESVAIVGAGLSGLLAARELHGGGREVRLFDKARGPGGRLATRRVDEYAFDHGAQYFTVRHPRFQSEVDAWLQAGVVQRWDARLVDAGGGAMRPRSAEHARYVGAPRMSALTRFLAQERDLVTATRVTSVTAEAGGWRLHAEELDLGLYEAVLVTSPPEQAVPLLAGAPALAGVAAAVRSEPCWAVMVVFERALEADFDGAFVDDARLAWCARNASKPGRPAHEAWVLHGTPAWSREHAEDAPGQVQAALLRAFFEATGLAALEPVFATAHRWMLARASEPRTDGVLWDAQQRIGACGDWCLGDKVEAAALSGLAAAQRVLGT